MKKIKNKLKKKQSVQDYHYAIQHHGVVVSSSSIDYTNQPESMAEFTGKIQDIVESIPVSEEEDFRTILLSCSKGDLGTVRTLYQKFPALFQQKTANNITALHCACRSGNMDLVKYLLGRGLSLSDQTESNLNVLHQACYSGNLSLVQMLVQNSPTLLAGLDKNGIAPMHMACQSGNLDLLKYLESKGLCSFTQTDKFKQTCLHFSCYEGHWDITEFLLKTDLSIDDLNQAGQSPLDILQQQSDDNEDTRKRKQNCLQKLEANELSSDCHSPDGFTVIDASDVPANGGIGSPNSSLSSKPTSQQILESPQSSLVSNGEASHQIQASPNSSLTSTPVAQKVDIGSPSSSLVSVGSQQSVRGQDSVNSSLKSDPLADKVEIKKKKIENRTQEPAFAKAEGIMFIVGIYGADGTAKDVDNIETTFKTLNFSVYTEKDPTSEEIAVLIKAAGACDYPYRYKYVAFYYAGHGGTDDTHGMFITPLQVDDANPEHLPIDEFIIKPLRHLQLTRLFFFDCCQSAGTGSIYRSCPRIARKQKPYPGEMIAYATSEGQKSVGNKQNGGLWTYHLCQNLLKEMSLQEVLSSTFEDVTNEREEFQEPTTIFKCAKITLKKAKKKAGLSSSTAITNGQQSTRGSDSNPVNPPAVRPEASSSSLNSSPAPKVKDVFKLTRRGSQHWDELGRELNLSLDAREMIATKYDSNEKKLEAVIDTWTRFSSSHVTWPGLVSALREVDELEETADGVEKFLKTDKAIQTYGEIKV